MPSVLWLSLPASWKLTEVQAGLQVMIALLCTWGIFAFSRFCWQLSSNIVRKNRSVALASLMSINTIGEAYDVIILLKRRIFRLRYWKLLTQSIVVVSLTVATIISGPIAKASTRLGIVVRQISVPGTLATSDLTRRENANVVWNQTYTSLEKAGYPLTQLMDFMPLWNSSWVYMPDEWNNNTWSMSCNETENTPITLVDGGVCGNMSVELPATNDFFHYDDYYWWELDWHALYSNESSRQYIQDALVTFAGWLYPVWDASLDRAFVMEITVASMHIHGLPGGDGKTKCDFGLGQAESASYTKMECTITRSKATANDPYISYPDCNDFAMLPRAYVANYLDRFASESRGNQPISMITPDELIRFYQTYIITKDTQQPKPVQRPMTANVQVVQLSSTFIAFGGLYALIVILGLVNYGVFAWKNRDVVRETPESKLDWIVQSIIDESELRRNTQQTPRRSIAAPSIRSEPAIRASEKIRSAFENAKYGGTTVEEVPLADNAAPQAGNFFDQSPVPTPMPSYGFTMNANPYSGSYSGYSPEPISDYNISPYEASYANQQMQSNSSPGLQNPGSMFPSDRRRGYHKLGTMT